MGGVNERATEQTAVKAIADIAAYCKQLEVDASMIRLKAKACEDDARSRYLQGHHQAAQQRFNHSKVYKQQELQIIKTITAMQQQALSIDMQELNRQAMGMMRTAVKAIHHNSIDPNEVDRISNVLHDCGDESAANLDAIHAHAFVEEDTDDWDAFVAAMGGSPPPAPSAVAAPPPPFDAPVSPTTTPPVLVSPQPIRIVTKVNNKSAAFAV
jgi:hypothetical protein